VKIDKNVETVGILYLISDIGLNTPKGSLSYEARMHFDEFKEHEIVKMFKKFYENTNLWGPYEFILCLSELPSAKIIVELDTNITTALIGNESIDNPTNFINQFVQEFNEFYKIAEVESFIQQHRNYYEKCINDVNKNLPDESFVPTMEKYYGKEFYSYNIFPSPILFPYIGIGLNVKNNNGTNIYYIAGPFEELDTNEVYKYSFDSPSDIREMSVHEFGHSFVNPLTDDTINRNKIEIYSNLFEPIKEYMEEQAYGSWHTCVNEHIVRLGEIRVALAMDDILTAEKIRNENIEQNKFIYLPYLEKKIVEYERNRDKYTSFSDFFPELIETFAQIDTTKIKL